jgi:hypothetical protein
MVDGGVRQLQDNGVEPHMPLFSIGDVGGAGQVHTLAALDPKDASGWMYTSNNDGNPVMEKDLNGKLRGNVNIAERVAMALSLNERRRFAYSKWELDPNNTLVNEIRGYVVQLQPLFVLAIRLRRLHAVCLRPCWNSVNKHPFAERRLADPSSLHKGPST